MEGTRTCLMAILIPLRRVLDDADVAAYDFYAPGGERGRLLIDKRTGDVTLVEEDTDEGITEFTSSRAIRVGRQMWERGEYPAEADYRH